MLPAPRVTGVSRRPGMGIAGVAMSGNREPDVRPNRDRSCVEMTSCDA